MKMDWDENVTKRFLSSVLDEIVLESKCFWMIFFFFLRFG